MKKFLLTIVVLLFLGVLARAQNSVTFEAESGTLGSEFNKLSAAGVTYITVTTDLVASQNPGSPNRVATYTVTFPFAGTYDLYGRVRVGSAGANDDSYFYGNGFGIKTTAATGTASDNDWITVNNLNNVGYSAATDVVQGGGSVATNGVWKWLNMSKFNGGETPVSFVVPVGGLTQTFQIGGRENGLDFDKIVFGFSGYYYTVTNLNNGEPGTLNPPPPPFVPSGPPLATGKPKFLGCAYSPAQKTNFTAYWNQVTPENGGKWGSVEATRNVMDWSELDSAYKLAKDNGFPFKFHTLIWGNQQPAWIETLDSATQLAEIREWFQAVAQRYPAIDMIEVVNEPTNDPPNTPGNGGGNYIKALGGSGVTGWDWVINSFRMARQYFPAATKLWINDYNVVSSSSRTQTYLNIINLLKAENLIDGIGVQAHAFSTTVASSIITTNLNSLAASGLPIYATELDIDGPPADTGEGDTIQLQQYQRVFPLFWEHPAVKGITLWGYRPGHWRTAQGAPLVYANAAEKPALIWLRQYVRNTVLPIKLSSFEAVKNNNKVILNWTATSELNNDRYVIEHSDNGRTYTTLLTIRPGATHFNYMATDDHPSPGTNYYRLVQYDKDGNKTYFGVRIINFGGDGAPYVQVYPNPASSYFTIRTEAGRGTKDVVSITNALGLVVKTFVLNSTGTQTVFTGDLANGAYQVQLNSNGTVRTSKIVILKN